MNTPKPKSGIAGAPPARPGLAIGMVLQDTYRIVRPLAQGGCGQVYVAEHTRLPGRFAVKALQRNLANNPEAIARFRGEAEITSTLRHPHIVQVLDFNVSEDGVPYLVMELLEGKMLSERVTATGALTPPAALHIIEQIAHALHTAHVRGIVHRDLKPENVILLAAEGADDFVKVLDFGISHASWRPPTPGAHEVAGTPEFMSPEQAAGRPDQIDHRTDQFSLAAIAYTLLTGREPFRGDDPLAILQQVVYFDPLKPSRLVPALSAGIDAVVMRGLAKKPDDRFADVLTFADALRGAIEAALHGAPDHLPAELEPPPIRAMAHAPGGWQPAEPWSEGPAGPETKQLIRKVRWGIRAGRMARIAMTLVTVSAIAVLAWFAPPTRAATRLSFSRAGQNARIVYQRAVAATTQRR